MIVTKMNKTNRIGKSNHHENYEFRVEMKNCSLTPVEIDTMVHRINSKIAPQINYTVCAKEYIARMLRGAEQLIKSSDYILEVKIFFHHAEPNITQFRLEPMAGKGLHNMRIVYSILSSCGEIVIDFPDDRKNVIISTDKSQLRGLLEQLIKNSIKYCVGKRSINDSFGIDKRNVRIKYKGNGVGISNNELPCILSPYLRCVNGESK